MLTVGQLQTIAHRKVCSFRAIITLLESKRFEIVWKIRKEDHDEVIQLLLEGNKDAIEAWMNRHCFLFLDDLGLASLRRIAKDFKILNYSRLSKLELLKEISDEKARRDRKTGNTTIQSFNSK